jgi:hypothetical protein
VQARAAQQQPKPQVQARAAQQQPKPQVQARAAQQQPKPQVQARAAQQQPSQAAQTKRKLQTQTRTAQQTQSGGKPRVQAQQRAGAATTQTQTQTQQRGGRPRRMQASPASNSSTNASRTAQQVTIHVRVHVPESPKQAPTVQTFTISDRWRRMWAERLQARIQEAMKARRPLCLEETKRGPLRSVIYPGTCGNHTAFVLRFGNATFNATSEVINGTRVQLAVRAGNHTRPLSASALSRTLNSTALANATARAHNISLRSALRPGDRDLASGNMSIESFRPYLQILAFPHKLPGTIPLCVRSLDLFDMQVVVNATTCVDARVDRGYRQEFVFWAYAKYFPGTVPFCVKRSIGRNTMPRMYIDKGRTVCDSIFWRTIGVFYAFEAPLPARFARQLPPQPR